MIVYPLRLLFLEFLARDYWFATLVLGHEIESAVGAAYVPVDGDVERVAQIHIAAVHSLTLTSRQLNSKPLAQAIQFPIYTNNIHRI